MECKKCKQIIDNDSKFCTYCGEKVVEEQKYYSDDPFKDLRIDNSHLGQYKYQQQYSNNINNNKNIETINKNSNNSMSLIGLIVGFISIILAVTNNYIIAVISSIMALVLVIVGVKQANRSLGITSLILTIISFIVTLIVSILMFVGSITITFVNGYETTIKNYFIDAFFCGFNEHRLEGYWINEYNELLFLDEDGNYYIYQNQDELSDNYYYGNYEIEEGLELNSDEVIFADEDYYYYQIDTIFNKSKINGKIYPETIDILENGFTIKLDKDTKDTLIITSGETKIEFERN